MNQAILAELIQHHEWSDIPLKVITREGHILDTSHNIWHFFRETSEKKSREKNAKWRSDWLLHNEKKLTTLSKQLSNNNIAKFETHKYFEELAHE